MIVIDYRLPAHWASYLINGDASGLEDGEQDEIDTFLERQEKMPHFISCDGEPYFSHSNDAWSLPCEVLDYKAIIQD